VTADNEEIDEQLHSYCRKFWNLRPLSDWITIRPLVPGHLRRVCD